MRKNFFLRPQEVLLVADCGLLELESWKLQDLCNRMFKPQELPCGSSRVREVKTQSEARDTVESQLKI